MKIVVSALILILFFTYSIFPQERSIEIIEKKFYIYFEFPGTLEFDIDLSLSIKKIKLKENDPGLEVIRKIIQNGLSPYSKTKSKRCLPIYDRAVYLAKENITAFISAPCSIMFIKENGKFFDFEKNKEELKTWWEKLNKV